MSKIETTTQASIETFTWEIEYASFGIYYDDSGNQHRWFQDKNDHVQLVLSKDHDERKVESMHISRQKPNGGLLKKESFVIEDNGEDLVYKVMRQDHIYMHFHASMDGDAWIVEIRQPIDSTRMMTFSFFADGHGSHHAHDHSIGIVTDQQNVARSTGNHSSGSGGGWRLF